MPPSPTYIKPPTAQSWSTYLLSTYSSSISPTKDPNQYAPAATPVSPSPSPSPWGPYTKSGRGGAGNFTWQNTPQSPTTLHPDPEPGLKQQSSLTARQKAAAEVEARDQADILAAKRQRSEYTHVGRGGAGNYTPSTEIVPSAPAPEEVSMSMSLSISLSSLSSPLPTTPQSAPPPPLPLSTIDPLLAAKSGYYGRGGAGNYDSDLAATAAAAKREAEKLETRREEDVRRLVEERVEAGMRRPEGALTREGRGREF